MAGDDAKISINGKAIDIMKNTMNNMRGFHIVVINPSDGQVTLAKSFDTYYRSDDFDNKFLNTPLPDGSIVVAAVKDEASEELKPEQK